MSTPSARAGLRLNVGCGPDAPPGWLNVDRSPHVIVDRLPPVKWALHRVGALSQAHMTTWSSTIVHGDIVKGLHYADGSADAIYSSHMLEHLYLEDAKGALGEFRRLLSPSGVLRLALPDSARLAAEFLARLDRDACAATLDFNDGLNAHPFSAPRGVGRVTAKLGASVHRWQPTSPLVSRMLTDAGFAAVVEREYLTGELPDLPSVEHRPDSFFLEATRR